MRKDVAREFKIYMIFMCKVNVAKASSAAQEKPSQPGEASMKKISKSLWNYNEQDNVYWQVGISYHDAKSLSKNNFLTSP